MNTQFAVKQLAKLAGVSVRTLHLYHQLGLLKPLHRTQAGYRMYGENELLRLQQILFYKELDLPLKQIASILDDPAFDVIQALEGHKHALLSRKKRLSTLLDTINKTVNNLKNKTMNNYEDLYKGLPKEQATALRNEAIEKWGEDTVLKSEKALLGMTETNLEKLKAEQKDINKQLRNLELEHPQSPLVQQQIERHYANIRSFWGLSGTDQITAASYKGLADLYVSDERYTTENGMPNPAFATLCARPCIIMPIKI